MNAVCGLGWNAIGKLEETRLVNEGAVAEQFIGQHLQELLAPSATRELNYWLREGRAHERRGGLRDGVRWARRADRGQGRRQRQPQVSLHQFAAEKRTGLAVRFDTAPPSVHTVRTTVRRNGAPAEVEYRLLSLPLYLVERLPSLLRTLPA